MADHTAEIHAALALTASPQAVTTGITSPPSPRVLSITGSAAGIAGNVVLTGTDYAGDALTDTLALSGTSTVFGAEAFATVTQIDYPARTHTSGDTVSVGWQDRLYSLPDARAFRESGVTPLSDATTYPNATILEAEQIVRRRLEAACRIALLPRLVKDYVNGNSTPRLRVAYQNPSKEHPRRELAVISGTIDAVALTATELAAIRSDGSRYITRVDGFTWSSSTSYEDLAVALVYWHGYSAVPEIAKRAALLYTVRLLNQSEYPGGAAGYAEGGSGMRFPYPGVRPHWTGDDEVDALIAELEEDRVVIA